MINLLPPQHKETYTYARRNRVLMHWVIAAGFTLLGALLLVAGGYLYLNKTIASTTKQNETQAQHLQAQNVTAIQKQVGDISNNLKLSVQVLSKQVLFSKLLKQLAIITPSNAILTNLSIVSSESGVTITAQTTNYDAATQLLANLSDPKNQVFSTADLQSVTCTSGTEGQKTQYPCTATIRALFADNNPYLFINDKATK